MEVLCLKRSENFKKMVYFELFSQLISLFIIAIFIDIYENIAIIIAFSIFKDENLKVCTLEIRNTKQWASQTQHTHCITITIENKK